MFRFLIFKNLKTQKENVYINDIVERNKIQNKEELEMLVQIIASDIGSLTNPLKLSGFSLKLKKNSSTLFYRLSIPLLQPSL